MFSMDSFRWPTRVYTTNFSIFLFHAGRRRVLILYFISKFRFIITFHCFWRSAGSFDPFCASSFWVDAVNMIFRAVDTHIQIYVVLPKFRDMANNTIRKMIVHRWWGKSWVSQLIVSRLPRSMAITILTIWSLVTPVGFHARIKLMQYVTFENPMIWGPTLPEPPANPCPWIVSDFTDLCHCFLSLKNACVKVMRRLINSEYRIFKRLHSGSRRFSTFGCLPVAPLPVSFLLLTRSVDWNFLLSLQMIARSVCWLYYQWLVVETKVQQTAG